jgi:ribosome-binding protein aMBF1 (putative translation factor)
MFYWEKYIKKGRKIKYCSMCGKQIDGTPHYDITDTESYCIKTLCLECYDECNNKGITEYDSIPSYEDI